MRCGAQLVRLDASLQPFELDQTERCFSLGRSRSNCLQATDSRISALHCTVSFDASKGSYYLQDHSHNGSWLRRGEKKWLFKRTRVKLLPGDIFSVISAFCCQTHGEGCYGQEHSSMCHQISGPCFKFLQSRSTREHNFDATSSSPTLEIKRPDNPTLRDDSLSPLQQSKVTQAPVSLAQPLSRAEARVPDRVPAVESSDIEGAHDVETQRELIIAASGEEEAARNRIAPLKQVVITVPAYFRPPPPPPPPPQPCISKGQIECACATDVCTFADKPAAAELTVGSEVQNVSNVIRARARALSLSHSSPVIGKAGSINPLTQS
jgi:hypothetical protein